MKRAPLALAIATIALAAVFVAVPDGLRSSTQTRASATLPPAERAAATPSANTLVRPIWRLDVPNSRGPFVARVSPDARLVAVESGRGTGIVVYEIQPPVAPSDVAVLKELMRLDRASGGVQWLPDSSVFLAYEPDGPSAPTGTLSLYGASGKRWSIATTGMVWSCSFCGARFSPDGRYIAFWMNPRGALVVALDGTAIYPIAGDDEQFAGWDAEGNLLFHVMTANAFEARGLDSRIAYTVPLPEDLRGFGGSVAAASQPPDTQLLSFDRGGCCSPSYHAARLLFDRKIHEIPAGFEDLRPSIGDGPWRGRDLIIRRSVNSELVTFDPRTGALRPLGVRLSDGEAIWGISGDYFALGRRIVELSTGREIPLSATMPQEVIMALGSGRFVLWRDGPMRLLDAAAWMATPQDLTDALMATPDQAGVQPGWVRVRDDDGGFTIALPTSWHAYDGMARGAVLSSEVLVPASTPSAGEMRIDIRLDIEGPRGPSDFLEGLGHHGGGIIERRTVKLAGASAEFATVYDNTMYPRPGTTLNWALRSPFFPERIVWIRAWPLESGRRAEVEAVVATLEFVAPR
jgi:hypothetical protein